MFSLGEFKSDNKHQGARKDPTWLIVLTPDKNKICLQICAAGFKK